jgi:lipopolysaccharide/colanic/teichoic acid biosynthesis glycosyltransferase
VQLTAADPISTAPARRGSFALSTATLPRAAAPGLAQPRLYEPTSTGDPHPERLRRVLNVVVAAIGLVVTAPFMVVIALLIKLTSPGPVFYSQTRVGVDRRRGALPPVGCRRLVDYGGRLFTIYKFRTMRVQTGPILQIWASQEDPRITPIGRFLRRTRLDELPQLVNVLRGEMNIVGPRPEQPTIVLDLKEQVDNYVGRQQVLPGITGWAQINRSYDRCVEDVKQKVRLDLEYIESRSALKDLRIMAATLPVMLFRRGAW